MNTTDTTTDYGDLLASLVEQKKIQAAQDARDQAAAYEAARLARLEALRPFVTILSQAKAKFPRASIFGLDGHGEMHFYTGVDTRIQINHDGAVYTLRQISTTHVRHSDDVIASSANPEDLIPTLMELLAVCVSK